MPYPKLLVIVGKRCPFGFPSRQFPQTNIAHVVAYERTVRSDSTFICVGSDTDMRRRLLTNPGSRIWTRSQTGSPLATRTRAATNPIWALFHLDAERNSWMSPDIRRLAGIDSWANCSSSRQGNQIEIWMKYLPTIIEVQGWLESQACSRRLEGIGRRRSDGQPCRAAVFSQRIAELER